MKLFAKISLSVAALVAVLFLLAGRPLGELLGLARAGADVTVDGMVDTVPTEVRDRALDHDLRRQQSRVTEHQIALNLSRREVETLEQQVAELEQRGARRQRLLAEAYPVLEQATEEGLATVSFAGAEHTLASFQADIDRLLTEEDRETRQLAIRREGLSKLTRSVADGERALGDMRDALVALEQEIELLRTRREQADLESRTLEMVAGVDAAPGLDASELGSQAEALRRDIERKEAANEARRAGLPVGAGGSATALERDYERLERLRALREAQAGSDAPASAGESGKQD